MRKLVLLASISCALATPVFASPSGIHVGVVTTNVSIVGQGGDGNGQVNVYLGAQGTIATVKAPTNASTVDIHSFFGTVPVDPP